MKKKLKQQISPFTFYREPSHIYSINQNNAVQNVFTEEPQTNSSKAGTTKINKTFFRSSEKHHTQEHRHEGIDLRDIENKLRFVSVQSQDKFVKCKSRLRGNKFSSQEDTQRDNKSQGSKKDIQILKEYLKKLMESQNHSKKNSQHFIILDRNDSTQSISISPIHKLQLTPLTTSIADKSETPPQFTWPHLKVRREMVRFKKQFINNYRRKQFRNRQKHEHVDKKHVKKSQAIVQAQQIDMQARIKLRLLKNWRSPTKKLNQQVFRPITNHSGKGCLGGALRSMFEQKSAKTNIDSDMYENIYGIKQKTLESMSRVLKFQ